MTKIDHNAVKRIDFNSKNVPMRFIDRNQSQSLRSIQKTHTNVWTLIVVLNDLNSFHLQLKRLLMSISKESGHVQSQLQTVLDDTAAIKRRRAARKEKRERSSSSQSSE